MQLLARGLPHPCQVQGVGAAHLVMSVVPACGADGGLQPVSYVAILYADGAFEIIEERQDIAIVNETIEIDGEPLMLGSRVTYLDIDPYWPYFEALSHSLRPGDIELLVGDEHRPDPEMQWSMKRVIGNDVIIAGAGRGYLACREANPEHVSETECCPPDAAAICNPDLGRFIPIPVGTYGQPDSLWY